MANAKSYFKFSWTALEKDVQGQSELLKQATPWGEGGLCMQQANIQHQAHPAC